MTPSDTSSETTALDILVSQTSHQWGDVTHHITEVGGDGELVSEHTFTVHEDARG